MAGCCSGGCASSKAAVSQRFREAPWVALVINTLMFGVEVVGGLQSGSVSLLADAVDFAGDAANYGLSLAVLAMGRLWRARAALVKGLTMGAIALMALAANVTLMTTLAGRTIIAAMRRLLMVVLMLILPLQWSAAAVAAYCEHEVDASAQQHFGHHQHEHHQLASTDSQPDSADHAAFDADCPTCHFLATPVIFSGLGVATLPPTPQNVTPYAGAVSGRDPDTPFRPPLAFLA